MIAASSKIVRFFLTIFFLLYIIQTFLGLPIIDIFGLKNLSSEDFHYYQFFTHIFVHANINHLLRNCFAFWIFGSKLEFVLGKKRFLALIFISAMGSAILQSYISNLNISKIKRAYESFMDTPSQQNFKKFLSHFPPPIYNKYSLIEDIDEYEKKDLDIILKKKIATTLFNLRLNTPSVGASGIIFGFLAGFTMLFPNESLYFIFLPIPIKAKYVTIFYGLYELYAGSKNNPADNVGHFAHLGGMIAGFIFVRFLKRKYLRGV